MDVLHIATENPEIEQWRLLSQFTYPANISKHLHSHGFKPLENDTVEFIAGSIRQGEAYFAAESAPLDILPLLLYYGAANLLAGAYAMMSNVRPPIKNHGMTILDTVASRIADVQISPRNPKDGALQQFCNMFSGGCNLAGGGTWTTGELLGSIPDLKPDFESHYQDLPYYTVPVEIIYTRQRVLERILNDELGRYPKPEDALALVPGLSRAFLTPQYKPKYVILHRRIGGEELGAYSLSGRKYLQLGHLKNGQLRAPHQLILMYIALYSLGFLPRYRPELWNPFVRSDTTGEKLIIEKFLSVCQRYLPNLVLNFIYNKRIRFVNETEGVLNLSATVTEREMQDILRQTILAMRNAGEIK